MDVAISPGNIFLKDHYSHCFCAWQRRPQLIASLALVWTDVQHESAATTPVADFV
jgi:hypothetical protein